jgi:hypothetical protein
MNRYDDTRRSQKPTQQRSRAARAQRRTAMVRWFACRVLPPDRRRPRVLECGKPRPSVEEERENVVGTSGYYSTEGGHDPIRRPHNTRDELKFRGELTPPNGAPAR